MQIWIAASIPPGKGQAVKVSVDSTDMQVPASPISGYGPHFAWYYLGDVKLEKGVHTLKITAQSGLKVMVDTLLVTPVPFQPNGSRYPIEVIMEQMRPIKRRR